VNINIAKGGPKAKKVHPKNSGNVMISIKIHVYLVNGHWTAVNI